MTPLQHWRWLPLAVFMGFLGTFSMATGAQNMRLENSTSIAEGVHLWYEIKADPEEPHNLILCGTKWDAVTNGPYGFVYASSDTGATWKAVLEDRNSPWVTEHSCAFGLNHRAYFISEASKVFDGQQHHDLGTTRLFVSDDAGKHWTERNKTGWADFSTSAVSSQTGRLFTFFNDPSTVDPGRDRGSSLGLLVFSPDGNQVAGPFSISGMREGNYEGVFPDNAIALKNGDVSALYYAVRQTLVGLEGELGFLRADQSAEPHLERTVISRGTFGEKCLSFANNKLAYDAERSRLFVLYMEGCKTTRMMLISSDDQGRTWSKSAIVAEQAEGEMVMYPSLAASQDGTLALLWNEWKEGCRRWLFGQIRDKKFVAPPIELSRDQGPLEPSNDSLWTTIYRPDRLRDGNADTSSGPSITVGVRGLVDVVWRSSGLIVTGDKILAIWPSSSTRGTQLNAAIVDAAGSVAVDKKSADSQHTGNPDMTRLSLITYGGRQSFDKATGTLTVCLALRNRGKESIRAPIKLEATDIESPAGSISILNATNGLGGVGAIWDISKAITGDRLPPESTTNPFCLSIHVPGLSRQASPFAEDLMTLKVRVLAPDGVCRGTRKKP